MTTENWRKTLKKILALIAVIIIFLLNTFFSQASAEENIVIDFKDDIPNAEAIDWADEVCGLERTWLNSEHSDAANIFVAEANWHEVNDHLSCLRGLDIVESADINEWVQISGAPNDPLYQYQWHFDQVGAEDAWETSTGNGVVVAVIDTGVALQDGYKEGKEVKEAKDLKKTDRTNGYDFVDDDDFPWDGHGHGTHVAGTIAQSTNNKYGVAGLSYGAAIMPLRVLNNKGFGQVADIADSIRFAADNGADVINMSLGGPLPTAVMSSAIKYAHKKGVTIVAAAGNGGKRKPSYPAAYKHVIAVAATQFDRSTTFYSQWGEYVDIAAPGGNTRVDQNGDGRPDGVLQETLKDGQTDRHDFLLYMGTSMASPHVAAGAALVIEQGITNPNKVEQILKKTADDSEKKRYKNKKEFKERYGAGIMQADAAAKQAVTDQGVGRMASVLALIGIALFGTRRRNWLVGSAGATGIFSMSAIMSGVGLFGLEYFAGPEYYMLSTPITGWWDQTNAMGTWTLEGIGLAGYGLLCLFGLLIVGVLETFKVKNIDHLIFSLASGLLLGGAGYYLYEFGTANNFMDGWGATWCLLHFLVLGVLGFLLLRKPDCLT